MGGVGRPAGFGGAGWEARWGAGNRQGASLADESPVADEGAAIQQTCYRVMLSLSVKLPCRVTFGFFIGILECRAVVRGLLLDRTACSVASINNILKLLLTSAEIRSNERLHLRGIARMDSECVCTRGRGTHSTVRQNAPRSCIAAVFSLPLMLHSPAVARACTIISLAKVNRSTNQHAPNYNGVAPSNL